MKTVVFQGKEYQVPEWAKWIAMDCDGEIFYYDRKPTLVNDSFYSTNGEGHWNWVAACSINPSCEEIK